MPDKKIEQTKRHRLYRRIASGVGIVLALVLARAGYVQYQLSQPDDEPSEEFVWISHCTPKDLEVEAQHGSSYDRICGLCGRRSVEIEKRWDCGTVETTEKLQPSPFWEKTGGPQNEGCPHKWHRMGGNGYTPSGHGRLWSPMDSSTIRRLTGTEEGRGALDDYAEKTRSTPLAVFQRMARYCATKGTDESYVMPFGADEPRENPPTRAEMAEWLAKNMPMVKKRIAEKATK